MISPPFFVSLKGRNGAIKTIPKWEILGIDADNRST